MSNNIEKLREFCKVVKRHPKITTGIVIFVLILMIPNNAQTPTKIQASTPTAVETPTPTPLQAESLIQDIKYSVENSEDTSLGKIKRYIISVVVTQEVNVEQLKEIAKKVVEENKEKNKFNAITIGFYDYKEYLSNGYTLGKVTFAPDGDFGKAANVSTGDYSSMNYTFELVNKDWSKRLTKNEVSIWKQFNDEFMKETKKLVEKNSLDIPDENKISEMIGKQNNLTKEKIDEILLKKATWGCKP
ncbi:hypothetical protein [Clostridium estertheticum]|uniref:DUF4875 domain-containing protein n=1 Tax=Clostridium estertheticum TaxID=238834 RepID=UPI001CF4FA0C|nr:hypothetical protein [Clostridium estertheticum]MCB2357116.1 hypothetical protein [Clostridium estertheticum]WAG44039.1 hypothetical protein LL065_26090 [Clostridium estertheticum]